jgi:hypothetical protein
MELDYTQTRDALSRYDAGNYDRRDARAQAVTLEDRLRAERAEDMAVALVIDAFYDDTRSVNSPEFCVRQNITSIRHILNTAPAPASHMEEPIFVM